MDSLSNVLSLMKFEFLIIGLSEHKIGVLSIAISLYTLND